MSTARTHARGFTIVELLTVMAVMGILAGLIVPMVLGARRTVQADQIRTSVNQQIRTAADLVGSDIRTAGERFPSRSTLELLPVEIIAGSGGESDEIILRRNLWEGTLPLCQNNLTGGNLNVTVAAPPNPNSSWGDFPECIQPYLANDWPRNLDEIRALAASIGEDGVLRGYIWNPTLNDNEGAGEFFSFEVPSSGQGQGQGANRQLRRTDGGSWSHTHRRADRPRIYVLEERRYRLRDEVLELVLNGDAASPLRAVAGVSDLQFRYLLDTGAVVAALPEGTGWRSIRGVSVEITASETMGREGAERTLSSTYFPRNVLSR